MVEQTTGALAALVIGLGYLLLLQAMTAAMILLAGYIVRQMRALRSLLAEPRRSAMPAVEEQDSSDPYRVGGGLIRWH